MKKDDFIKLGVSKEAAARCESAFAEALEHQLAEQRKTHAAELSRMRLDNAVDHALTIAGAKNGRAVKALLDLGSVTLGDDGKLSGLDEQLAALVKSDGYLFAESAPTAEPQRFTGFNPGASVDGAPKPDADFSQMTYSQMVAYAEKNPNVKFG